MKKRGPIATLFNRCIWPVTMRSTRRYPRILAYHRFSVEPHERKRRQQCVDRRLPACASLKFRARPDVVPTLLAALGQ